MRKGTERLNNSCHHFLKSLLVISIEKPPFIKTNKQTNAPSLFPGVFFCEIMLPTQEFLMIIKAKRERKKKEKKTNEE